MFVFLHIVKCMITVCIPKLSQKIFYLFSLLYIRIGGESVNFDDNKIKKGEFYKNKKITSIDEIDFNKILVSKREPYGTKNSFKYFIGYNNDDVIRPLCARLPQVTGYTRTFDENAAMSFRVNNKQLLRNSNKIWENVEKSLRIDFEKKPVYGDDDKYIKTEIKKYTARMITNVHN